MKTSAMALACAILLPACSTLAEGPVQTEVLLAGRQCGATSAETTIVLIDRQSRLDEFQARLAALEIPSTLLPKLDFTREAAVLIEMGQRPTAGYGLAPAEPAAQLQGRTLEIRVDWQEPDPGMAQAQMLTSPCLLLKIPAGNYEHIVVRDTTGRVIRVGPV